MSKQLGGARISTLAPSEQHPDNAWQTPSWLVERIRIVLGGIDLDPCTMPDNPTKARRFFTPGDDGILQPWVTEVGGAFL